MTAPILLFLLTAPAARAADLKPETLEDFERYIRTAEAAMDKTLHTGVFLRAEETGNLETVHAGRMWIVPVVGKGERKVRNGLIHDWEGAVFIPGATPARVLAMVQNYDNHKNVYKPEVMDSKLIRRNGDEFQILLRLWKKKVITAVLDTYHDVRYFEINPNRWYSRSYTTRISEVDDPGKPNERNLPPDTGHGFMWRLNTYWRFDGRDGGTYLECRTISLSRDVPAGLGWLIIPIIRTLPRDSVERTLRGTRDALQ